MKSICNVLHGLKPVMLMVMVQVASTIVNVLYKLAINDGMSVTVATAYRLAFASAFIVPLALISERKNRPKLTWRVLFMAFLCGLFGGSLFQNLFYGALALTSATFVSAIYNLVPAITFILAIFSGLEKLNLRAAAGKVKILGTLIGIGGAMFLTFYKGVKINIWPFHINLLHSNGHMIPLHVDSSNKLVGVLCAIASCFSYALWLILQAKMSKEYSSHYSSTALVSTAGAIQATIYGFCVERDWSQWKLGWNIKLLTIVYSGIVGSGLEIVVIAWCIHMRGPLFASVFNPLMLVLVAVAASLMLNENLYLGSVVGAVMIVCGLYMVLWGKRKEMKNMTQLVPSEILEEAEAIEVVVDNDKCDYHNQTSTIKNVDKDLDYL
ncbi:PREDICTED: WAT1-related protein At1g68170-like [Lupinus angustifolius]|uniref:WAT1-related protein At1g68170-like n=1 Tax=Lupinus angustifolius TaxID=3871 RepID=UPI00092F5BC4|nr:PREDICTED: WAT1-related protein At1g68170-like [Lupinus angustifolius]